MYLYFFIFIIIILTILFIFTFLHFCSSPTSKAPISGKSSLSTMKTLTYHGMFQWGKLSIFIWGSTYVWLRLCLAQCTLKCCYPSGLLLFTFFNTKLCFVQWEEWAGPWTLCSECVTAYICCSTSTLSREGTRNFNTIGEEIRNMFAPPSFYWQVWPCDLQFSPWPGLHYYFNLSFILFLNKSYNNK